MSDVAAPLPLYWLKIGMRIEREEEFAAEIERRIHRRDAETPGSMEP